MNIILVPLISLVLFLIQVLTYGIFAHIILGWLFFFQILNPYHKGVQKVADFLDAIIQPFIKPFQKRLPQFHGFDFSPMVLVLILWFVSMILQMITVKMMV
jgi:YggT family protein